MIIEPDFLDDWRTRMLVDLLQGDECAPLYLIRLWSYCQTKRTTMFDMPADGLKAQCRYKGNADRLENAMLKAGYVERNGSELHVLLWAEQNAKLVTNWNNGKKGGRPPSVKTEEIPPHYSDFPKNGETMSFGHLFSVGQSNLHDDASDFPQQTPKQNPTETQPKPPESLGLAPADLGSAIREDKRRTKNIAHSAGADAPAFSPLDFLKKHGVEEKIAKDWLKTRSKKRLADTETAFEGVMAEIAKAGLQPNDAIKYCCEVGWGGFKAHWPRTGSDVRKEVWES